MAYIRGQSQTDPSSNEFISFNPVTFEAISRVPITTPQEVAAAVERAKEASKEWSALPFRERGEMILKVRSHVWSHSDEIADLISQEMGKPKVEALSSDIIPTLDIMTYFAKSTERLLRERSLDLQKWRLFRRTSSLAFKPLGVVGIIAPWNFPWSIPFGEVIMALMAGNAVLLKPSEHTPLIALKMLEVTQAAGIPEGVFQVLTGDGRTGEALVRSKVQKIFFTGSVKTGKRIMAIAAENLTPVMLELGGKDPVIVCDDVDVDRAAQGVVWGAFVNCGQVCASVERCYVSEKIADPFISRVVELTEQLRVGPDPNGEMDVSTLVSEDQLKIVMSQVEDAKRRGAKILTGGDRLEGRKGYFFAPTVLTGVDHTFEVMREETFGPLLPIVSVKDDEEAIRLANDSRYGLNAYVWTTDLKRGERIAKRLEAGSVAINEVAMTHAIPQTPWGGIKESGIGRTHGDLGLMEMVEPHHIHTNRMKRWLNPWWYPYNSSKRTILTSMSDLFFAPRFSTRLKAIPKLVKGLGSSASKA